MMAEKRICADLDYEKEHNKYTPLPFEGTPKQKAKMMQL